MGFLEVLSSLGGALYNNITCSWDDFNDMINTEIENSIENTKELSFYKDGKCEYSYEFVENGAYYIILAKAELNFKGTFNNQKEVRIITWERRIDHFSDDEETLKMIEEIKNNGYIEEYPSSNENK